MGLLLTGIIDLGLRLRIANAARKDFPEVTFVTPGSRLRLRYHNIVYYYSISIYYTTIYYCIA